MDARVKAPSTLVLRSIICDGHIKTLCSWLMRSCDKMNEWMDLLRSSVYMIGATNAQIESQSTAAPNEYSNSYDDWNACTHRHTQTMERWKKWKDHIPFYYVFVCTIVKSKQTEAKIKSGCKCLRAKFKSSILLAKEIMHLNMSYSGIRFEYAEHWAVPFYALSLSLDIMDKVMTVTHLNELRYISLSLFLSLTVCARCVCVYVFTSVRYGTMASSSEEYRNHGLISTLPTLDCFYAWNVPLG